MFYGGELVVLTDPAEGPGHGIMWVDVNGTAERGQSRSWVNKAEAQAVVNYLHTVLRSANPPTIGVITPFRGQADLIRDLLAPYLHPSLKEATRFVASTAHALQGNERDLIVFSAVVAPGVSDHAQQWVEQERHLINVAVSRARHRLVGVGHPDVARLGNPTLASLRSGHVGGAPSVQCVASVADPGQFDSTAERSLYDAARRAGLDLAAKRNFSGYELDFAVETVELKLNIEVDGDQHLDSRHRLRRQDVTRDRMLHAQGWSVIRIPAWRCHADPEAEVLAIMTLMDGGA